MTDDGRRFEIPKDMRAMAEAGFDQARQTFEQLLAGAEATAGSLEQRSATVRAGTKDIGAKVSSYAEKNVQSSLDDAQSLVHAKNLPEVLRLHREFVQGQMRSLAEQASEMGQAIGKAAIDTTKPKA
ncbi:MULTISPECIES: phasin family protein [unclassified Bradyrhizobium]|uniref:phasin family protein n=1 Tax=unclassified Bradyrhizobium TaxID=2631580 RepID=UPI0028E6C3D0|nr:MULTISPECIES: phasin family protein [unclassified Bradyrhizobium]